MRILKEKIKELASQQGSLKQQRKYSYTGVRTTNSPVTDHLRNRDELRHLYMAYGLMRGRTQEQVERNPKSPISMTYVEKLITKYSEEAVCPNP